MALAQEELAKCQYDPADHPLDVVFIAELYAGKSECRKPVDHSSRCHVSAGSRHY
jgi:hypothetical protein